MSVLNIISTQHNDPKRYNRYTNRFILERKGSKYIKLNKANKMENIKDNRIQNPFIFVLMPFDKSFDDIYEAGIKPVCESCGALCQRVDEQIFTANILHRVYDQISKADLIISEMTGKNPNVFYETGYAHALGKKAILITNHADDIPFDLKHYPHIIYDGKISTLKLELEKRVRWCIENEEDSISSIPNLEGVIINLENLKKKQIRKLIQSELSSSFKNKPIIFKEIIIEPDMAKVYCVTFIPNKNKEQSFDESWIEDDAFEIKSDTWGFIVHKSQIREKLKKIDYPYKFYLKIKNDKEEKRKYYARLLESECTVTGQGDIHPDDGNYWRVWFIINNEYYHPDVDDLMRLNHTLVNSALQSQPKNLHNLRNPL